MNRVLCLFLGCLVSLAVVVLPVRAQQPPSGLQTPPSDLDALRDELRNQASRIEALTQTVVQQAALIEDQRKRLDELKSKAEAPAAPQPAKAAPPKQVNNVESGAAKVRFGGLVQGWFGAGDQGFKDTFRIRRTELKFTGEITPEVRWTLMIDPAKALSLNNTYYTADGTRMVVETSPNQSSRVLQDVFITLGYLKPFQVDIGQYKVPLGLEGTQSSATIETVERALFSSDRGRGGALSDVRDIGVQFRGPLGKYVDVQAGFFNGVGETMNEVDRNDQKAIIGRLVVRPPFVKGLQIGGSAAWSNSGAPDRPRRDRAGAELLYKRDRVTLKSEFMSAEDGDLHRAGYYVLGAYRFGRFEPVFRFDAFDPDTRLETVSANATERDYVVGLNYFLTEHNAKLQINYLRKTFANDLARPRNLVLVNLQTSW